MPWIIVGAGGVLLIVLTPLVGYLGYRTTRRKRVGSGWMWGWYGLTFELFGVTLLLAWAQAHVSGDTAKELLSILTLAGAFAWILAGARFGMVLYAVWGNQLESRRPSRDDQ